MSPTFAVDELTVESSWTARLVPSRDRLGDYAASEKRGDRKGDGEGEGADELIHLNLLGLELRP